MPDAVIVAAARSPIGRANNGTLGQVRADDLAAEIIRSAMDQVPQLDPTDIVDLHLGCALPCAEQGSNLARIIAVMLGWRSVPGTTINRFCASSLQTTRMAFHAIKAGEGEVFVSAGVDIVSRYPPDGMRPGREARNPMFAHSQDRSAKVAAEGADEWKSRYEVDKLPDVYIPMGQTAENVAIVKQVTREEMDDYAFESQRRYAQAKSEGFWEQEITPIKLPDGQLLDEDESPRPDADRAKMAELPPVFRTDGRVTAGNSCPINDGASVVIVMSEARAKQLDVKPLARIVATAVSALDPEIMGMGPVEASRRALAHAGMTIDDMDIVEINEAFAAQVIPSARELGVDFDRLNPHGGAIAVGHPFGMTGARITGTLINGLQHRDGSLGLETMCVGGGQGMAMVVERLR